MASRVKPKTLILGTGRAGTSFLMQILQALKLDTGFDRLKPEDAWLEKVRAGHELDLAHIRRTPSHYLPQIIKHPRLSESIDELVSLGFDIGNVILPIRNINDATHSRNIAAPYWGDVFWDGKVEKEFRNYETFLTYIIGKVVHDCTKHDIKCIIIKYPLLTQDWKYCYDKLSPVVAGISPHIFEREFKAISFAEQLR